MEKLLIDELEAYIDEEFWDFSTIIDDHVHNEIDELKIEPVHPLNMDLKIYSKILNMTKEILKMDLREFTDCFNLIEEHYGLSKFWIYQVTLDAVYKNLTERMGDLHLGNLGFRATNKTPIFFDW